MNNKNKIYSAYSILTKFRGFQNVRLHWLYTDRRKFPASFYCEKIPNFLNYSEQEQEDIRKCYEENFTFQEIIQAQEFLEIGNDKINNFHYSEFRLDLNDFPPEKAPYPESVGQFSFWSLLSCPMGGPVDQISISQSTERSAPFDFVAYYDLEMHELAI